MSCATEVFTLGHSPDPDDAFMFYAIAKNKIDLRGYRFEHRLEDIQTLNERAMRGELHISAIPFMPTLWSRTNTPFFRAARAWATATVRSLSKKNRAARTMSIFVTASS